MIFLAIVRTVEFYMDFLLDLVGFDTGFRLPNVRTSLLIQPIRTSETDFREIGASESGCWVSPS